MAAGSFTLYNETKKLFFDGTLDWDTDTHYCHLLGTGYTPAGTHNTWSDVSAQEIGDTGYSAQLMSGEAVNGGTATATADCDAANVTYGTNVTISAQYAVIRTGTATPGTGDNIVGYVALDTATAVSSTNGTFEIQWHGNGLWTIA